MKNFILCSLLSVLPWDVAGVVSHRVAAQGLEGPIAVQLACGEEGRRIFLRGTDEGQLGFSRQATGLDSAWYVMPVGEDPVGQGIVRLQQSYGNRWLALGLEDASLRNPGPMGPRVQCLPLGQSPHQLWRIVRFQAGGYLFESVSVPGLWLSSAAGGGLWLQPFASNPWQIWWPQRPLFSVPVPQYRTVSESIVSNPALPPAMLRVTNTHSETLMVLLADRRDPAQTSKLRIPAGGSETVRLDRDAGATIIQTIEIVDALGNWDRQEYQIPIPPSVLYDMSVYEEFLQSIAIDRTGKSPNVIEDVNYQPRSIGFFLLPAGDSLPESGSIDAFNAADDAKNPGAVRKLSTKDLPNSSSQAQKPDPLKELLDQLQSKRGKF